MMWWMVVLMSAGLIALGVGLLARDILASRTTAPKRASVVKSSGKAKSSPLSRLVQATLPDSPASESSPRPRVDAQSMNIEMAPTTSTPGAPRLPALEKQWVRLRPEIEAAINSVNQKSAPLSLSIGNPGEASWSLHNQGFGDYRRVLLDRDSVAWLRLEVGADQRITARLRAHEAENATINRDSIAPARRTAGQLTQTLNECLTAVFEYAVWRHSNNIKNEARADPTPSQTAPAAPPSAPIAPPAPPAAAPFAAPSASPAAMLVDAAVMLVNRAFTEVGAQLLPTDAPRGPIVTLADRALSINVAGRSVGLLLIEPRADRIDISVGVSDLAHVQAARRHAQPMAGLTVHALAEAIATNAWPAIAAATHPSAVA